jgi:NAD(P)-dependent dehydrogenase (short-subunit alcohol dehydrogenase family)
LGHHRFIERTGAALVEELLQHTSSEVIGIARTGPESIESYKKWIETGRYQHVQLDISSLQCRESLKSVVQKCAPEPIGVIFSAAYMEPDVNPDRSINFQVFEQVNRVGIDGIGNTLFAFEQPLRQYGGIFVGISSFSAFAPPIIPKLAYPSIKAYLDMMLRCLRTIWPDNVKFVTVHLGHIGDWENVFSRWNVPTYAMTAAKIVRAISGANIPPEINYPLVYTVMFKYIFPLLPDSLYMWGLRTFLKSVNILKSR